MFWDILEGLGSLRSLMYLVYSSKRLICRLRHYSIILNLSLNCNFLCSVINSQRCIPNIIVIHDISDPNFTGPHILLLFSFVILNCIRILIPVQDGSKLWHVKVVSQLSRLFCFKFIIMLHLFRFRL